MLELSRIHAGALDPRLEPIDVGELTRSAVRRLRYLAGRDRVRLTVEGDVVIVSLDPDMIELVIVVLLENALRFAPRAPRSRSSSASTTAARARSG